MNQDARLDYSLSCSPFHTELLVSMSSGTETEKSVSDAEAIQRAPDQNRGRAKGRGRSDAEAVQRAPDQSRGRAKGRGRPRGRGRGRGEGRQQFQGIGRPETDCDVTETEESEETRRISKATAAAVRKPVHKGKGVPASTDSDQDSEVALGCSEPVCIAELFPFCRWVLSSKATEEEQKIIQKNKELLYWF